MSEQKLKSTPSTPFTLPSRPQKIVRRAGCFIGLAFWIILLLTPCFCLTLASQGEITINLGDVPGQSLRIWLINESRERGIAIAHPTLHLLGNANNVCLQTDVSFVLWMGQGTTTRYCDCYAYNGNQWTLTTTYSDVCPSSE